MKTCTSDLLVNHDEYDDEYEELVEKIGKEKANKIPLCAIDCGCWRDEATEKFCRKNKLSLKKWKNLIQVPFPGIKEGFNIELESLSGDYFVPKEKEKKFVEWLKLTEQLFL